MNKRQSRLHKELDDLTKEKGYKLLCGWYVDKSTHILICCPNLHITWMTPTRFKDKGTARACKECPIARCVRSEANFREGIKKLGGTVIGIYVESGKGILCLCSKGHTCRPSPDSIKQKYGMCKVCAQNCPKASEKKFREKIKLLGGKVYGRYIRSHVSVLCKCKNGHWCSPHPANINHGHGMCRKCVNKCFDQARENFEEEMKDRSYTIKGKYTGKDNSVLSMCERGHDCDIVPSLVRDGYGYCRTCYPISVHQGKTKDALKILGLDYIEEFRFPATLARFDFKCGDYFVECDGEQHFRYGTRYTPTEADLLESHRRDNFKMNYILSQGYKMLRFDYSWRKKSVQEIADGIIEGMRWMDTNNQSVYLSKPKIYEWVQIEELSALEEDSEDEQEEAKESQKTEDEQEVEEAKELKKKTKPKILIKGKGLLK